MAEANSNKPPIKIIIDTSLANSVKPSQSSILTRFHAGYFRITLSLGSQALLWKILMTKPINNDDSRDAWLIFRKFSFTAFLLLWWLTLVTQFSLSILYLLKCFFHFNMVKAEFLHYIGVNFFYSPWISWLLLLQSSPLAVSNPIPYLVLCWGFSIPILMLDVKLYGQWFTTERRFLSTSVNPTSQLSVIGNLVVATAAAQGGHREGAVCMLSLGMVHYLVLFVTLYQRFPGNKSFPAVLRPAFFLFFAAPSIASFAWKSMSGAFDTPSKMLFFLSLFLFLSLACRPTLFNKSIRKYNVARWSYSFSLTFLALASSQYAKEVQDHGAFILMLVLSALSVMVLLGLILLTVLNTDCLLQENDPILKLVNNSGLKRCR
ncbi:hypothetical protein MANES_17G029036v8 [Manihot esculenta]|uniref:S-type anion channel SLAH1 n=3 Tax=Manihot esculenta TaxID=3983 RepID=A0A2C9V202_MANES|nr:hypothetical protein MANES_17G029036v8 [Manihot esculenta]